MFKYICENKGFVKLEKEGIFYNYSLKKFEELKKQNLIKEDKIEIIENIKENSQEDSQEELKKPKRAKKKSQ